MNDQKILELIRAKEHNKAVKSLFRHFRSARKIVKQYDGTNEDAEDIFQDALVIFYNKVENPSFILTSSIQTFLVGICKNLIRDKQRKVNREENGIIEFSNAHQENDTKDYSRLRLALKAVEQLGEKCLKILQAYYFEKQSMNEIASNFGYSSSKSAKNQKYKCLERARKMVREKEVQQQVLNQ